MSRQIRWMLLLDSRGVDLPSSDQRPESKGC